MKRRIYILSMVSLLFISGCGGATSGDGHIYFTPTPFPSFTPTPTPTVAPIPIPDDWGATTDNLKIVGKITYDRVPVNSDGIGLDYNSIRQEPSKQIIVKLVKDSCAITRQDEVIASTMTNNSGEYEFNNLPKNQNARICVYAQMKKDGSSGWDLEVVDNTNNDALYIMQSGLFSTGEVSMRRNLNASSGWNGNRYSSTRTAAPFAILGSMYQAMQKVTYADSKVNFPKLKINWSVDNVPAGSGDEAGLKKGQIITSHYDGDGNLYILGDANTDTDEYDDHVIIHEWGHYFEDKFSRADSIGGPHGDGNRLDIRVAFGEGWGNAWSAIATDNPIYFDTQGYRQSDGFSMNIESEPSIISGWYSEASVQHILYDLYDIHDDGADTLALGFKPIYKVLVGFQKNTKAFTSIFTFITGLQSENPSISTEIDNILASEDISHIYNIYGSTQNDLYSDMVQGEAEVCTSNRYGVINKLDNHKYIRFSINQSGTYKISVVQNNGSSSDPDFGVYKTTPFEHIGDSDSSTFGKESAEYDLSAGEYLLDVGDYNGVKYACFDVTIN